MTTTTTDFRLTAIALVEAAVRGHYPDRRDAAGLLPDTLDDALALIDAQTEVTRAVLGVAVEPLTDSYLKVLGQARLSILDDDIEGGTR